MDIGEKCICQCDDWFNAFGETTTVLQTGMRLTVAKTRMVNGLRFYGFEETPGDNFFLYDGFRPMRELN